MSTAKNDVTGDLIKTKESTQAYYDGWDRVFGKKKTEKALKELVKINEDLGLYDGQNLIKNPLTK